MFLNVLHLKNLIWLDGTSVERLVASCPVLEELVIDRATGEQIVSGALVALALQRLVYITPGALSEEEIDYVYLEDFNVPRVHHIIVGPTELAEATIDGRSILWFPDAIKGVEKLTAQGTTDELVYLCYSLFTVHMNDGWLLILALYC